MKRAFIIVFLFCCLSVKSQQSVARKWNEVLLEAIRNDYARPTVHARNLFHISAAMFDAWAVFSEESQSYLLGNDLHGFVSQFENFKNIPGAVENLREKAVSYAAYRLIIHRFSNSPGAVKIVQLANELFTGQLGYDANFVSIDYSTGSAAALGNYIAMQYIEYGLQDGSNEANNYENVYYTPINAPLNPSAIGNQTIIDPNRWQPLSFEEFIDQSGNVIKEKTPAFLSPEWGNVASFALTENDLTNFERNSKVYHVYFDPGQPPQLGSNSDNSDLYKWAFTLNAVWASHLSSDDGVLWDISPNTIGNISFSSFPTSFSDYPSFYNFFEGGDISMGRNLNPVTGAPYQVQVVPRGDYTRVLAEFWADGPDSETPPGHWFVLLNYVSDHIFEKRFKGEGEVLNDLEWDIKSYFILGGVVHDAAIAAWGIKGWYDYIRPISAIRYMASKGQSTDSSQYNYNEDGISLIDGYIEIVQENDALAGENGENIGKIKLNTWKGHDYIDNPENDVAGVGWILAENWWPYQRPSFVTPPFAGYLSGHSTYSRAAAETLTLLTGSECFPEGLGEFIAKKNEFLVFEEGPSQDVKLQWATYRDASDQCSLSRIWGGIHPPVDDIPGRIIGEKIGRQGFEYSLQYFSGKTNSMPDLNSEVLVYPNPITNELNIKFYKEVDSPININVYDMMGKLVLTKTFLESTIKINMECYSKGLYLLNFSDKNLNRLIVKK
ncbi:T9SS type A sorting domain-containing protein [Mariniflexile jejuense]|uniref:T9SS type A sorting domain-containing protein n=1 Tax=Mariniflexile jejuense TaxID=1173582 RepID=A0ABW3JL47_9FLAO